MSGVAVSTACFLPRVRRQFLVFSTAHGRITTDRRDRAPPNVLPRLKVRLDVAQVIHCCLILWWRAVDGSAQPTAVRSVGRNRVGAGANHFIVHAGNLRLITIRRRRYCRSHRHLPCETAEICQSCGLARRTVVMHHLQVMVRTARHSSCPDADAVLIEPFRTVGFAIVVIQAVIPQPGKPAQA